MKTYWFVLSDCLTMERRIWWRWTLWLQSRQSCSLLGRKRWTAERKQIETLILNCTEMWQSWQRQSTCFEPRSCPHHVVKTAFTLLVFKWMMYMQRCDINFVREVRLKGFNKQEIHTGNFVSAVRISVGHTHLHLLCGWLISGDLVCLFFLIWLLFFFSNSCLQLVVHKVFERVQVSFSFVLFCLHKDNTQESTLYCHYYNCGAFHFLA